MKRQGDLLIEKIQELPRNLKDKGTDVIAMGDSTNLAHRLASGNILVNKKGDMFLKVKSKTQVIHEHGKGHGHRPIDLSKGFYKVIRQREITAGDMTRVVID